MNPGILIIWILAAYRSLKNAKIDDFDADFDAGAPVYDNEEDFFDNWQKRVERERINHFKNANLKKLVYFNT